MERKKYVPRWLKAFSDEALQQNALLILGRCYAIINLLENNYGGGDEADIKAARINLRDALSDMTGNKLWSAVMAIRPQVINGRLPVSITEEIARARPELANALNQRQIRFFRAVISGGEFTDSHSHYFPGIPLSIRKEVDVRLTTHPDNLQLVVGAYAMMANRTTGHAKTAMEEIIADIKELAKNL